MLRKCLYNIRMVRSFKCSFKSLSKRLSIIATALILKFHIIVILAYLGSEEITFGY